ncbi:MAG: UbiA family prenyltransferase [Nitrososphaerota archaeon]
MKASLLYKEFVLGGHMLALGTAGIAATSALLMQHNPTFNLLLMAYLFSYGAYSINRRAEMQQDMISNPERTSHLASRSKFIPLISSAYLLLGYILAITVNIYFFTVLLLPLILAFAYSIGSKRLEKLIGARRLKDKLLVKNVVISLSWALIPFIVSLYYLKLSVAIIPISLFIFFRLMLNTIFFDVRDVEADRRFGVSTVPVVLGINKSFKAMELSDIASALIIILSSVANIIPSYSILLVVTSLYSFYYRHVATRDNEKMNILCDLVADGEYLLWAPVLLAGRLLSGLVV